MLICFIDKGEGLPQVKQVAPQISLKSNPIECVILLCGDKGVERLEVFTADDVMQTSTECTQEQVHARRTRGLEYITN